jgi:hypothetical protein
LEWMNARRQTARLRSIWQRALIDETHEHLAGMSRWIEQTGRQLGQDRERRGGHGDNSADA